MKLYLETSVPNFLFAEDAPEKRRVTEMFFEWLKLSDHQVFMKINESKVMREIRVVRDQMARRVEQEGIFAFYASLAGHAAELMARHRSSLPAVPPRHRAARKAQRRALVDTLPEPKAIQEVRRIRNEMLAEEKRVGSDPYWAGVNQRGKEFARRHGLKYVESPPAAIALHDQPAKKP
jgi:hypothetical protein